MSSSKVGTERAAAAAVIAFMLAFMLACLATPAFAADTQLDVDLDPSSLLSPSPDPDMPDATVGTLNDTVSSIDQGSGGGGTDGGSGGTTGGTDPATADGGNGASAPASTTSGDASATKTNTSSKRARNGVADSVSKTIASRASAPSHSDDPYGTLAVRGTSEALQRAATLAKPLAPALIAAFVAMLAIMALSRDARGLVKSGEHDRRRGRYHL